MTHMSVIVLLMNHVNDEMFCIHEDTTILKMRENFVNINDERQTKKTRRSHLF